MHSPNEYFIADDPDERSFGRVRQLSSTDADEVIRAIAGSEVEVFDRRKQPSFVPIIAISIFCIFYLCPIFTEFPCAHSCLAILILAGVLWGTEIIPSYITAYLMPLAAVWLSVGYDETSGTRIPAPILAEKVLAKFSDPIIFVFLGSLTMSAALTKLSITERISAFALSRISKKPQVVLFTIMLLNFAIASLLSNIASTTLVLSFSLPIIRSLDPDDKFIKAILFGLAWSGNAGGMITPIASAQNILAIKYINESGTGSISFIEWIAFGGPPAFVILIFFWAYCCLIYKPTYSRLTVEMKHDDFGEWTWRHTFTCVVTFVTILCWALQETVPWFFGHVGVTSLVAVFALFSAGILNSDDFGHLRWSTLALMGGGIALGEAMDLSGLLGLLASEASRLMEGIPVWVVCFIFLALEAVLVSVINHVSAGAILFPVLKQIGNDMGHPNLLLILSALMIACAQLFAMSSFPCALVSGVQKHQRGDPNRLLPDSFLTGTEFFTVGWPTVLGSLLIICSIGYGIVVWIDL